jgi:hypothetical protein
MVHPVLVVVVEVSLETSVRIVPSPVKMEAPSTAHLVHVTVVTSTVERSAKLVPEPVKMEVH